MIYLIQTIYHITETNSPFRLLKIGYTEDKNKQVRYCQYKLHNPLFEVLFEIPNATEDDERKVHNHFQKYQYQGYGREWFVYSEEIIDFFKSHATCDSLISLPDVPENKRSELTKFRKEAKRAIEYVLNIKTKQDNLSFADIIKRRNEIVEDIIDHRIMSSDDLWGYIKEVFDVLPPDNKNLDKSIRDEVNNFLAQFESAAYFTDKMRLLCESNLSEGAMNIILDQVPIDYKTFYVSLGPERIKANCYKKGELAKELKRQLESTTGGIIGQVILANFKVGERISMSEAKQRLKGLYALNNIQSAPKAVELSKYFEVKKTKVKSSDGTKFVDGYEILKIKKL